MSVAIHGGSLTLSDYSSFDSVLNEAARLSAGVSHLAQGVEAFGAYLGDEREAGRRQRHQVIIGWLGG